MPVTRSSTRAASNSAAAAISTPVITSEPSKRKRKAETTAAPKANQKRSKATQSSAPAELNDQLPTDASQSTAEANYLVSATLTFSLEDAKNHLIGVDSRFEDLFNKMACKPFQHLEQVHPFRALVTSILGQQISWMAARSINHRFVRLFNPSIPENYADYKEAKSPTSFFPIPNQVANMDIATLRTAGLSARKAEYVQDLAKRFADGRLSTEKLIRATDEELAKMLIEVRGIGKAIDMFAIFSLRRPDILPVGDLGVQRGLVRWFLTLHSPNHRYSISPEKVSGQSIEKSPEAADEDELPTFGKNSATPDMSSVPPTVQEPGEDEIASMPPPFTPSIKKTLEKFSATRNSDPVPLPPGLSVSVLKSRLNGKNKIKGAFLTPKEMEDLTEHWRPYRSIGVYYMWSLADVTEEVA